MKFVVQHNMCIYHCLQQANTSAYKHWFPQMLYSFLFYRHAVALADWQQGYIDVFACLLQPTQSGSIMNTVSSMSSKINTPIIHNTRACKKYEFAQGDYNPSMVAI
jgi:hypothetical protein